MAQQAQQQWWQMSCGVQGSMTLVGMWALRDVLLGVGGALGQLYVVPARSVAVWQPLPACVAQGTAAAEAATTSI
jgi:hypothetical protein